MNDEQLLRYSRHLLLEEIDVVGQEKLLKAHVLVIGAGGLGSAAEPYLAAAGVGHITLIDHDAVELTNLQRQIMHAQSSVGKSKVASGKEFLERLNSTIQIETIQAKATSSLLDELLPSVDVVLDCTDNFSTGHLINAACIKNKTPLVSGSTLKFDGQVTVFDPRNSKSPCYACSFSPDEQFEEISYSSMGIFSPLVGRMLLWSGRTTQIDEIHISRNDDCSVCGSAN